MMQRLKVGCGLLAIGAVLTLLVIWGLRPAEPPIYVLPTPTPEDPTAGVQAVAGGVFWGAVAVIVAALALAGAVRLLVWAGAALADLWAARGWIWAEDGMWPVRREALAGPGGVALAAGATAGYWATERAAAANVGVPTHDARQWHGTAPAIRTLAPEAEAPPPSGDALTLPGRTTLGQVLAGGWRLDAEHVLHAVGGGGRLLTAPASDTMHMLFAAPTGVGKTNLMLLMFLQFQALGYAVYWLDMKFRPYHERSGIHWGQLMRLTAPRHALTDPREILDFLEHTALVELPRRRRAFNANVPLAEIGGPMYLFIEEALVLAGEDPKRPVMTWVSKILAQGRELGIFVAMAVQGALIKQLGGSVTDQAQTRTRYCGLDADDVTRRRLLELASLDQLPAHDPDSVEAGVLWLRSEATRRRVALARVPLVTWPDALAVLPQLASAVPSTAADRVPSGAVQVPTNRAILDGTPTPVDGMDGTADPYTAGVVARYLDGNSIKAIIEELHPEIDSKSGGRPYRDKRDDIEDLIRRELIRLRQRNAHGEETP